MSGLIKVIKVGYFVDLSINIGIFT